MKLSKSLNYAPSDSIEANLHNKGQSCFIVTLGCFTDTHYVTLFRKYFDEEQTSVAYNLYHSINSDLEYMYTDAKF